MYILLPEKENAIPQYVFTLNSALITEDTWHLKGHILKAKKIILIFSQIIQTM